MAKKKTIKGQISIDQVVHLILRNNVNMQNVRHALFSEYNYECTEQHARRLYNEALEIIRENHDKQFEVDYEWCRNNYMNLYQAAMYREDWKEARHLLTEMRKLFGLEDNTITHKFSTDDNSLEAFKKLFE